MLELLRLLLSVLVGLLRHQLAVALRSRPRPKLRSPDNRSPDKLLWILARRFCPRWRHHLLLVTPHTVVRWHRRGWSILWRWRLRSCGGRPRLSAEVRELIVRMARENALWGIERIRSELLKLEMTVSIRSIRRSRGRGRPRPASQSWRTCLANHRPPIWAADLFTVQTLAFKALSVLIFLAHGRRELVHFPVTAHPTASWIGRQFLQATPSSRTPKYLIRDRDRAYGPDFTQGARALGTETLLTPIRAPRANAVAERVIGTLRRECLDHLIIVNEQHLRAVLREFVAYDNAARPHRTLGLESPLPAVRPRSGVVRSRSVLGGLHHVYARTG